MNQDIKISRLQTPDCAGATPEPVGHKTTPNPQSVTIAPPHIRRSVDRTQQAASAMQSGRDARSMTGSMPVTMLLAEQDRPRRSADAGAGGEISMTAILTFRVGARR